MSSYSYSTLPKGSIRLLRLAPQNDKFSTIQCHLFELPLSDSQSTYPYEALSYVWGSEEKPRSISIDNYDLPIGQNLHDALSQLRYPLLERIIWIDAICINQGDTDEKGRQVQSMAKIYAKASRVIVWLGSSAAESHQALEELRFAASEQPISPSRSEIGQQAVLTLLRRPWFQRIWVLQEVAAARHVVIICGATEIDGYAFCSGLNSLNVSYETCSDLQPLVRSVTYLIRGAIFRSRCANGSSDRFSLDIRPLRELVEMYHTRKATQRHDKVYALLGMSSDDPSTAGLLADYKIPWRIVFQNLIVFLLSPSVSAMTWDDKEMAVIQSKGQIIGEVSSVDRDTAWDDRQTVEITWRNAQVVRECVSRWTFQVTAKSIQVGDVVCLLQGASKPTIARLHGCHWMAIMIAVPTTDDLQGKDKGITWLELLQLISTYPHDFLLVWDWNMHSELQGEVAYEHLIRNRSPEDSKYEDHLDNAVLSGNIGLILQDLRKYKAAEHHLRKSMEALERALAGMDDLRTNFDGDVQRKYDPEKLAAVVDLFINVEGGWPPLKWAVEDGYDAAAKLLLSKADPNIKNQDGQTPMLWAATNGYQTVIKLLLSTGRVDLDDQDAAGQTPLSYAAKNGHDTAVELLLGTGKMDPDSKDNGGVEGIGGRTPLSWAAQGGHVGVVKLLLKSGQVDPDSKDERGGTPLLWAVKNGHAEVVSLLLHIGKVDPDVKETDEGKEEGGGTPLLWAAKNGSEAIVKLLLGTEKVDPSARTATGRTPLALAAENGNEAVVELLLNIAKVDPDSRDKYERTPLSLAAENGYETIVKLLLDTEKVNPWAKDKQGRDPLVWAVWNRHEAIINLLGTMSGIHERQVLQPEARQDNRFLDIHGEDYFDSRCQRLYSHVRQWVLRFSKFADMRAARLTSEIQDERIIDLLDDAILNGSDVDSYLRDRVHRRDVFMSITMTMIWEFIFTRYLFGLDREQRRALKAIERLQDQASPVEAVRQWRAITLTLLAKSEDVKSRRNEDTESVVQAVFKTLSTILLPPSNLSDVVLSQLRAVMQEAVRLSIDMRTQRAEYLMLPPLRPEYDTDGDVGSTVQFNASLMNERSEYSRSNNEELEAQGAVVRLALFPLVVKKGGDDGAGDEEIVVFPAQVLAARRHDSDTESDNISHIDADEMLDGPSG
ncbi:hypothetical protein F66182_7950 [Fusarium sp. NRRL 66182]|nr:hypothetical protein F66182_7950 [Fusarium sp. NRRL 66182]